MLPNPSSQRRFASLTSGERWKGDGPASRVKDSGRLALAPRALGGRDSPLASLDASGTIRLRFDENYRSNAAPGGTGKRRCWNRAKLFRVTICPFPAGFFEDSIFSPPWLPRIGYEANAISERGTHLAGEVPFLNRPTKTSSAILRD